MNRCIYTYIYIYHIYTIINHLYILYIYILNKREDHQQFTNKKLTQQRSRSRQRQWQQPPPPASFFVDHMTSCGLVALPDSWNFWRKWGNFPSRKWTSWRKSSSRSLRSQNSPNHLHSPQNLGNHESSPPFSHHSNQYTSSPKVSFTGVC